MPRRRHRTLALDRNEGRKVAARRLARTILLGTVAVVLALLWLGKQYGIDPSIMLEYLGVGLLFVAALVAAGLVGALLLGVVRKLTRR